MSSFSLKTMVKLTCTVIRGTWCTCASFHKQVFCAEVFENSDCLKAADLLSLGLKAFYIIKS